MGYDYLFNILDLYIDSYENVENGIIATGIKKYD